LSLVYLSLHSLLADQALRRERMESTTSKHLESERKRQRCTDCAESESECPVGETEILGGLFTSTTHNGSNDAAMPWALLCLLSVWWKQKSVTSNNTEYGRGSHKEDKRR